MALSMFNQRLGEVARSADPPFLRAGADAVVGTLWAADDQASRELQLRFHDAWLEGRDSAEALRAAQLALIRDPDPRMSAPRAWAAFQSIGIAW